MLDSSAPIISIFGPGLLGGSLALAVQRFLPAAKLRIWARREAAFAQVRAKGIHAECTLSAAEAAHGASLIILATPVETMAEQARQIAGVDLAPGAIVTDVGSVKGSVVAALGPILGECFIGSHPMAGSEKAGIGTARADLFQGAVCLVTPTEQTDPARLERLKQFWAALGCRVRDDLPPAGHDAKVARISHLPHLMAAVTTLAALRGDVAALDCAASGFRDSTRVAGGDPGLWTGIVLENRAAILERLRVAAAVLTEMVEILEKPDEEALRQLLAEAKELRDRLPAATPSHGPA